MGPAARRRWRRSRRLPSLGRTGGWRARWRRPSSECRAPAPGSPLSVAGLGCSPLRAVAPHPPPPGLPPPWPSPLRRAQRSGPAGQRLRQLVAEQSLRGFVGLGGAGGWWVTCWGGLGSFALLAPGGEGGRLWLDPPSQRGEGARGSGEVLASNPARVCRKLRV